MDYSQIIKEFDLSYDMYYSGLPEDYNWYGIYDCEFDWYSKEGFKEFVLHYLIGHCIRMDIETPENLEEGLRKHFIIPEYAYKKLQEFVEISKVAIAADKNFQDIADFLNKSICNKFGPARKIFWIGKLKELVVEDSEFAKSQRKKFHGSSNPLSEDQIPDFLEFSENVRDNC